MVIDLPAVDWACVRVCMCTCTLRLSLSPGNCRSIVRAVNLAFLCCVYFCFQLILHCPDSGTELGLVTIGACGLLCCCVCGREGDVASLGAPLSSVEKLMGRGIRHFTFLANLLLGSLP